MITPDEVDVCDADPGHQVTATIETGLRTLTRVWVGDLTWAEATRSGELAVDGSASVRRPVPRWLTLSSFASVPRPTRSPGADGAATAAPSVAETAAAEPLAAGPG